MRSSQRTGFHDAHSRCSTSKHQNCACLNPTALSAWPPQARCSSTRTRRCVRAVATSRQRERTSTAVAQSAASMRTRRSRMCATARTGRRSLHCLQQARRRLAARSACSANATRVTQAARTTTTRIGRRASRSWRSTHPTSARCSAGIAMATTVIAGRACRECQRIAAILTRCCGVCANSTCRISTPSRSKVASRCSIPICPRR